VGKFSQIYLVVKRLFPGYFLVEKFRHFTIEENQKKKRGWGRGCYEFLPYFEEKRELISPYLDHS
jgi:hypothetical protein